MSALLRSSVSTLIPNSRGGLLKHFLRDLPARVVSCNLFSEPRLKIDSFLSVQSKVSRDFGSIRDQFLQRVKQNLEDESKVIFTEDVKNVIYLAAKDDLPLLSPLLSKYVRQNTTEIGAHSFQIGPLVSRLLHTHRQADLIYKLMTDPALSPAFSNLASYVTACDLLLLENRAQEAVNLAEQWVEMAERKYPLDLALLYAQACCKLGTPEAQEKLKKFLKKIGETYRDLPARVFAFYALLSSKVGRSSDAYELAAQARDRSVVAFNATIRLHVDLGLHEESLAKIKSFANTGLQFTGRKPILSQSLYDELSKSINEKGDQAVINELTNVNDLLVSRNLLDSRSLDEIVNAEILASTDRRLRDESRPQQQRSASSQLGRSYDRLNERPLSRQGGQYDDRNYAPRDRNYDNRGSYGGSYGGGSYDDRNYNRNYGDDRQGYRDREQARYSRAPNDQYSRDY